MINHDAVEEFPVICVGGETDDLKPFTELIEHLPANLGAAIVIIDHMRRLATELLGVLSRHTQMPVELITGAYPFSSTARSSSIGGMICTFWTESSI